MPRTSRFHFNSPMAGVPLNKLMVSSLTPTPVTSSPSPQLLGTLPSSSKPPLAVPPQLHSSSSLNHRWTAPLMASPAVGGAPPTFAFVPLRQVTTTTRHSSGARQRESSGYSVGVKENSYNALDNIMISSRFSRTLSASYPMKTTKEKKKRKLTKESTQSSAERLNLYIDRQQDGVDTRLGGLEQIEEEPGANVSTFRAEPKTARERWKQNFRIALPHVGLVFLSAAYTLLGAAIFHHFETPFEMHIRNNTSRRVQALKNKVISELWALSAETNLTSFYEWSHIANTGMNMVIRDVFIDYTKNYMTPDDIIYGTGPTKWSFGSSVFFSWTAITTIGYGHIVPLTLKGRISCLLYALFGIPLILVTIADMGRFLSGGIIWVHHTLRKLRKAVSCRCRWLFRLLCCRMCRYLRRKRQKSSATNNSHIKVLGSSAIDDHQLKNNNSNSAAAVSKPSLVVNHVGGGAGKPTKTQRFVLKKKAHRALPTRHADSISDAGTFEDISDIHTQDDSDKTVSTNSEDTRARADEIEGEDEEDEDEFEPLQSERRVSVMFILVVMLGYTAGGACLMQLWERWSFVDAFYFCFVTVTTIGFGDIVPQNVDFLPATLAYIVVGLIITTMCIDLVGSEYIRDIHFYGRTLGRSFLTIGGKVVHLGEVFSYVAFLQKSYGLTPDQLDRLAQLPEEYLLDCLINGRQPDLNWIGGRPFIPPDIYYFKWIEQPRTLSFTSERVLASMESEMDLNTSRCSTARTLTPREYYQRILVHYCKQMQQQNSAAATAAASSGGNTAALNAAMAKNEAIFAQNQNTLFTQ